MKLLPSVSNSSLSLSLSSASLHSVILSLSLSLFVTQNSRPLSPSLPAAYSPIRPFRSQQIHPQDTFSFSLHPLTSPHSLAFSLFLRCREAPQIFLEFLGEREILKNEKGTRTVFCLGKFFFRVFEFSRKKFAIFQN